MIIIRLASSHDLKFLPDIEREAARLFPEGRVPDLERTHDLSVLEAALRNKLLFVAETGEQIAGFALASEAEDGLHLVEVDVHPDCGRRGIGRKLIARVVEEARERHKTAVTLTTFEDLPWNAPFYQKLGFEKLSEGTIGSRLKSVLHHDSLAGLERRVAMIKRV